MKAILMTMLLFLCIGFILQGCASSLNIGSGAGRYVEGELRATYSYPLDRTWEASLAALKDLNLSVVKMQEDLGVGIGTIEATRSDGTQVRVDMRSEGLGRTLVEIRVGPYGDKTFSKTINDEISSRLG